VHWVSSALGFDVRFWQILLQKSVESDREA
jgi:hypothetical protein